jgi:hypothetical protein
MKITYGVEQNFLMQFVEEARQLHSAIAKVFILDSLIEPNSFGNALLIWAEGCLENGITNIK